MTGKYKILTWGCQMNEEDSEQMSLYLEGMGYVASDDLESADVVLLNTCSVRQKPVDKVYSKLGQLREMQETNPNMIIGVCGCMAQVESVQIRQRAPYVDLVVGTGNIAAIPNLIQGALHRRKGQSKKETAPYKGAGLTQLELPERKGAVVTDVPLRNVIRKAKLKAHVPIMYGCDKFCTFCIVPFTRGRERSRPTAEIVSEIEGLARAGTREVTLLGQTVNSYGKNLLEGRVPFATLLQQINDIRGIQRIRFTSPYPRDFTDDLIEAIAALPKVCEHIHLPLQVADDELLSRMHRGYTLEKYDSIVTKLRNAVPGIAITTDIMLGFPGETDQQFRNTMDYVTRTRFDSAFMFAYSIRQGTKAADMEDQIPQALKLERLNALVELQNNITSEINASMVGDVVDVLVEGPSQKEPSKLTGYTRTLKAVNFTVNSETRSAKSLVGKTVPVRLLESGLTGFIGEYAEPDAA